MKIKKLIFCSVLTLFALYMAVGCSDSGGDGGEHYDSSKPIVFSDFTPKQGAVRTRLYIEGSNFGKDISKIQVSVGGKNAKVIGSSGDKIYVMVPRRAYGGEVKVVISGDNEVPAAEYVFPQLFEYVSTSTVSTLVGKVDPATGSSSMIDGAFAEAEFQQPWWLLFDENEIGEKILYVGEPSKALRKVNLNLENVSTVVTNGQGGFRNFQTMTFGYSRDTMFFADDNGQNNRSMPVIHYSLRNESYRKVYPYILDRCGYSCTTHPEGTFFYNTYFNAAVIKARGKYDEVTHKWDSKELYNLVDNNNQHSYMIMHPLGDYAYIMGYNSILKAVYDRNTHELLRPTVHVGKQFESGYVDAPGTGAKFSTLRQGVFVRNEEYVREGKPDIYDFYVCDVDNHCIRLVTPEGQVTTFAGRGSYGVDGEVKGYIDGDLRLEARFNKPSGISYDEKEGTFYVADMDNKRIRYITVE